MTFLSPELWYQQVNKLRRSFARWHGNITTLSYQCAVCSQFVTLDGLNSGVPTRTTPTLTPTTLRNIEQTFIELQSEVESHQNEAGFVPPVVQPITQGINYKLLLELLLCSKV